MAQASIVEAYGEKAAAYHEVIKEAKDTVRDVEEWNRLDRELNPVNTMAEAFLEFEASHRGTIAGLSALYHLVAFGGRDANSPANKAGKTALDIAFEHYSDQPTIVQFVRLLNSRELKQRAYLEKAGNHLDSTVRAMSLLTLAESAKDEASGPIGMGAIMQLIAKYPALGDDEETRWVTRAKAYWEQAGVDPAKSRTTALELADRIIRNHNDVRIPSRPGRAPILLDAKPSLGKRTFGESAEAICFELTHLSIGSIAPEIAGPDVLGKHRSLHAQRGKVVVVMFSFKGCGPCEEMYPGNRKLVERYADRPFAFLGVAGDESAESVKESLKSGDITWPVLWDGPVPDGRIASRWNVKGWPNITVIDHHGVVRYRDVRGPLLAQAVKALVAEAESSN